MLQTTVPGSFYFSRVCVFALIPVSFFFYSIYHFPLAVPIGIGLLAVLNSMNRVDFELILDDSHLRVVVPSFYGRSFSTVNLYARNEIRHIRLTEWTPHMGGLRSTNRQIRDYANLEIEVEDKVMQETSRYTFSLSVPAKRYSLFWDSYSFMTIPFTKDRRKSYEEFVSAAQAALQ